MIDGHAIIADLGCGTGALSHVMRTLGTIRLCRR